MIAHDRFPAQSTAQFNIVLVHGMAEHGQRYHEFARYLSQHGGNVITFDLRGHGKHYKKGNVIDFGNPVTDGAQRIFQDIEHLFASFKNDLPNILFGHSMGSVIALRYVETHTGIKQLILTGVPVNPPWMLNLSYHLAQLEYKFKGLKPSIFEYSFKQFNNQFKPNRTEFDWLSLNPHNVDQYIADPLCGQRISTTYYVEMFEFMRHAFRQNELKKLDPNTSILMLWGSDDPCTRQGKGTRALLKQLQKMGYATAQIEYPGLRHEILNEENRLDIFADIVRLIQA